MVKPVQVNPNFEFNLKQKCANTRRILQKIDHVLSLIENGQKISNFSKYLEAYHKLRIQFATFKDLLPTEERQHLWERLQKLNERVKLASSKMQVGGPLLARLQKNIVIQKPVVLRM